MVERKMSFKRKLPIIYIVLILCLSLFLFGCTLRQSIESSSDAQYVTVNYMAAEGGRIDGENSQEIELGGDTTVVTAVADEGYKFVKWSDGVTVFERTDIDVTQDVIVTAIFEKLMYRLEYTTDGNGTLQGESNQLVAYGEKGAPIIAIPEEGYEFLKWSDGVTTAGRTDIVTEDISVTAIFERSIFIVEYQAGAGGILQGETKQTVQRGGSTTVVKAIPNERYQFVRWSDGVINADRTDVSVSEDISVTAIFKQVLYTIEYQAGIGGTVQGESTQTLKWAKETTSVTAVPAYGYRFVQWSDGLKTVSRTDTVTKDKVVIAEFERIMYTVTYVSDENGSIEGNAEQIVGKGEDTTTVTAVPNEGYQFVKWSDGVETATRTDLCIEKDLKVTAEFEIKICVVEYHKYVIGNLYEYKPTTRTRNYGETVTYPLNETLDSGRFVFVEWSDGVKTATRTDVVTDDMSLTAYFGVNVVYKVANDVGGTIEGDCNQTFYFEESATAVTAKAKPGYVFAGWSDLSLDATRNDGEIERCWEYLAYFEPIEKTFTYDYGDVIQTPWTNSIAVHRNTLQDVKFIVPKAENYIFCGWYIDKDYSLRIANEDGRLMLGYYTFLLETDTIYAKWKSANEDTLTYKTLLVMTDEIHASLESSVTEKFENVDYKMSSLERRILSLIPTRFSSFLNEWFEGKVVFETDVYFTTAPIGTENERVGNEVFEVGSSSSYDNNYYLNAYSIIEIGGILGEYHSILNTFCMNDYEGLVHWTGYSGLGNNKYACIYLESLFKAQFINEVPLQDLYVRLKTEELDLDSVNFIYQYLHEFTHTVERAAGLNNTAYHNALGGQVEDVRLEQTKLFLLGQGRSETDGEIVGIPATYWKHEIDVVINYTTSMDRTWGTGDIALLGDELNAKLSLTQRVPYGSNISVVAIPRTGYRFVKWSDGVTTAVRHDRKIISYLNVKAIFEKI